MKKLILATLVLTLLGPGLLLASGTSSPARSSFPDDPLTVVEVVRCEILDVQSDGLVIVRDRDGGRIHPLEYHSETEVTAQDKKAFDGRKILEISDLAVGQRIKVSMRPSTGEVVAIRVLKEKRNKGKRSNG